jgi:hypothetical protein
MPTETKHPASLEDHAHNQRHKIVRQDRVQAPAGVAWLRTKNGNVRIEVLNYSAFGVLGWLQGSEPLATKEALSVTFSFMGFDVQDLKLAIVREDAAAGGFHYAFEILTEPLDMSVTRGIQAASQIVAVQNSALEKRTSLHHEFRLTVIEVKDWLTDLAAAAIEQEKLFQFADPFVRSAFENSFAQTLSDYFQKTFPAKHAMLLKFLSEIETDRLDAHLTFFREQLSPIIHQAPFSNRAYNKPRGYAGDFEMMNQLYRNALEGPNLFARALHHYFINEPAGQAVRNRKDYLIQKIHETLNLCKDKPKVRILSVASGPARELQDLIKSLPADCPHIELHLIDQDEESLKGAQFEIRRMGHHEKVTLKMVHASIKQIIVQGVPQKDYDLIYSAGLFDYFSDPVAQTAASRLYDAAAPKGTVVIGNFSLHNPTLPLMNMAWDWHLIYRSAQDLERLFRHVGPLKIEAEPLGINLFAVIKK